MSVLEIMQVPAVLGFHVIHTGITAKIYGTTSVFSAFLSLLFLLPIYSHPSLARFNSLHDKKKSHMFLALQLCRFAQSHADKILLNFTGVN